MSDFRKAVRKASIGAFKKNDIGLMDLLRIGWVSRTSKFKENWDEFQESLESSIKEAPEIFPSTGPVGEIDWDALADFLERIMPLILEFIKSLLTILPASDNPLID